MSAHLSPAEAAGVVASLLRTLLQGGPVPEPGSASMESLHAALQALCSEEGGTGIRQLGAQTCAAVIEHVSAALMAERAMLQLQAFGSAGPGAQH